MPSKIKLKKRKAWATVKESIILAPADRRDAILSVIRGAEKRLLISLFRCNDNALMKELFDALKRKVRIEALVTPRAKGGKLRLQELGGRLESMGAHVHSYPDQVVKYHAKYLLADEGPAVVASLNFTKKCFRKTCDFVQISYDPEVVSGLARLFESDCHGLQSLLPPDLSSRLIVGPDRARAQLADLLGQARHSIHIIDRKVTDSEMLALLEKKKSEGVDVRVLSGEQLGDLVSHGKLILVDDKTAAIGSISLSTLSLEFRRELALRIQDPRCVRPLVKLFRSLAAVEKIKRSDKKDSGDDNDPKNDKDEGNQA